MNMIFGVEKFEARKEPYQTIDGDVFEHCDVCVIGSGAAGAILAKKFSDAGRSVVLLEKGGYFEGEDMNQRDEDMTPLLWKNSGFNFTDDIRIAIAQGSCLGGSTVINDAVCFPIPEITRTQWGALGVQISDDEWDKATDEVSAQIHVTKVRDDELDRNSLMLKKGCERLGLTQHYANSRNCVNCMQCGLCHLGCHYETKQDMRVTYIHNAISNPNATIRVYCDCSAEKINYSDGVADSVEGDFLDIDGNTVHKIVVNARLIIIAAGSIASTYLLLKNNISQDRAGLGLALHPAPFIIGDFEFQIKANQGIPMAYTLHEFGVTNGVENGGFLVEGIFVPPLQFALLTSGTGVDHAEIMDRYDHFAMAGVLVRDDPNGRITLTEEGYPRVTYTLGTKELDNIARGVEIIAKMWFTLGATRVITSHIDKPILQSEQEISELVNAVKNSPQNLLLGSAHPQGGNHMGSDETKCVVDSDCKVYGFKNLFVCDASVFPTAVGVNPQLTVMSLATITANRINNKWKEFASIQMTNNLGQICSITQPMYCPTNALDGMYEVSDTKLSNLELVNSSKMDIVEGENWTFDVDTLTIHNDRYWKGFFAKDHDLINTAETYAGGFWKRFQKDGDSIKGITHPYGTTIYAKNEAILTEYPGFGKVILLKYLDPPYDRFYDLLKIVDKDTLLGEAFAVRPPPRGEHILTFSMSKKYSVDFMTQDDFKIIFSNKARRPEIDEVIGIWEGKLISDATLSPVLFRFRFYKDQGELKCDYIFGGFLPGTSTTKLSEKDLLMFDFTGQLMHDELRMIRKDLMVGKYCTMDSSIIKRLGASAAFIMKDDSRECLPYLLRRI